MANAGAKPGGLAGLRIVSFESRRAQDMAILLRRNGGEVLYAPSMREVPLADERGILEFGSRLFDGECDALVLLTGVGTTILVDASSTRWPRAAVLERLGRVPLICRNVKTAAVVRRLGLEPALVAPEPNGPKELLAMLDAGFEVKGKRIFVQEYGAINAELLAGLATRGARVELVKIYRWALPEDTRDLKSALIAITQRRVDAAVFTSAHQVDNVLDFAERLSLGGALREAFQRWALVIPIGPVTSEALARHGIAADLVPEDPKRAPLVKHFAQNAAQLLRAKRGRAAPETSGR
ncbi:MAG TPA: uroporphyrinogen-III synthase [Polyangiaceae bacterium]|jgi:uroporphyrinogen-III synthase|nr:uroporphyrinogen-III synthase [Polyangiaceae bacterium]